MDVVPNHMCDRHVRQSLVERRARERPQLAVRHLLRHRLASAQDASCTRRCCSRCWANSTAASWRTRSSRSSTTQGAFYARYWQSRFPIGPRTILPLLEPIVADMRRSHPPDHPDVLEIESIVTATTHLPTRWDTEPEKVRERMREKEIVKRRLDALVSGSAAVRDAMERSLGRDQRREGESAQLRPPGGAARRPGLSTELLGRRRRGDQLPPLLRHQRPGRDPRRAAQRARRRPRQGVPAAARGQGDRPAHRSRRRPDGPAGYLENLQQRRRRSDTGADAAAAASALPPDDQTSQALQTSNPSRRLQTYVLVEKILSGDETLPREWPVHGTTGYEFLTMVNDLLVDAGGARAIERLYQRLREGRGEFDDLLYLAKRLILRTAMSSELYVLARRLDRISEQHRWSRDFTQNSLHLALAEVIACFPVYRTYDARDLDRGQRRRSPARAARDPRRQAPQPLHQRIGVRLHRRPAAAARSRRAGGRRPRRAPRVRAPAAAADRAR